MCVRCSGSACCLHHCRRVSQVLHSFSANSHRVSVSGDAPLRLGFEPCIACVCVCACECVYIGCVCVSWVCACVRVCGSGVHLARVCDSWVFVLVCFCACMRCHRQGRDNQRDLCGFIMVAHRATDPSIIDVMNDSHKANVMSDSR